MIRIIDDAGNNLAFPIDMENPEVASMIMDSLKIDIIMRELREKSVEEVVSKLLELKISDHTDILRIVTKLFDEAAISLETQDKFGELTKKLVHVLPSLLSRNKIDSPRFKPRELIAIKVEKEFWKVIKNKEPTMHYGVNKDRGMTMFMAHLYNIDMVPDDRLFLLLVLLSSRQKRHKNIKLLLKQIKARVLKKMSEPYVKNQGTTKLFKFLKENKIIVDKKEVNEGDGEGDEDVDGSDSDASHSDDGSSTSVYESASDSEKPTTSKSIKNTPKSDKEPSKSSKTNKSLKKSFENNTDDKTADIIPLFQEHLSNLKSKKRSSFNIQLFKSCNDDEKRQCSKNLLQIALSDPEQAKTYAEIVLSIIQLSIPTKISKKNFSIFLKEAFEEEMKKLSKQVQDDQVDWTFLECTGKFLAELYVVEGLKISVFNKWLEEAKSLAIGSDTALKILFDVFKIFQSSMKKRDENSYKNLMGILKEFRIKNRISKEDVEWFDQLMKEIGVDALVPSSEKSKSASSTGVVKKIPQQPNSSPYQTCKKFQEFLTALKADETTSYQNYKTADTSKETLQACASIFLENCIVEPQTADTFCKILNSIVLPTLSKENQARFKKYLKYYVYTEMAITVNLENYESSNWDRSGKLTCCMCEFYKIYIFEMDLMDGWLDRLHLSTKSHYSESNREFQAGMLLAATVMGRREPNQGNTKKITKRLVHSSDEEDEEEECNVVAVANGRRMRRSKYMGILIIDTDESFRTIEMNKFTDIVLNIQKYSMDDVIKAFNNIEIDNDKDFEKFLKGFYDLCLKCPYPSASASIAKFLCLELNPFEFREKISKLVCDNFREKITTYNDRWDDFENEVDIIALVAAEFYNYGIISCQSYMSLLEKQAANMKTTTQIFVLHVSIFATALKLVMTGDGSDLQHVYQYFKSKPRSTPKHELNRRYRQFIDHFAAVFEQSAAVVKESQKKLNFSFIVDNLNENNFENSVKFVERLEVFKNKLNAGIFLKKCLTDMTKLDIHVRFMTEIAKVRYDFKDFFQGLLVVEFGNILDVSKDMGGTVMKPLKEADIPKVQKALDLLIALYRAKFCNSGYIDLFLQFLSQEVCENRLKCAGYLLKILGARLERERLSMIEESFARINQSIKNEKCKILFDRIQKLSNNRWKFECDEDEKSYMLAMGADWKNKEEKEEVVTTKNKKLEGRVNRTLKRKIEKEDEKKLEEASPEKSGNNDEVCNLDQVGSSSSNKNQKDTSSSNLDQGGPSSSKQSQRGSSSLNKGQRGPSVANLDQKDSSSSNKDQGGPSTSNLDQNESNITKADPTTPNQTPLTQATPQTPTIPTPQDPKPLTPNQIKQNYEFFTKTESDFEIFLRNLQNSPTNLVVTCHKMAKKVTKADDSQKVFLQIIWKYCLIDGSLVTETAEICKNLTEKQENFNKNLEKFIKSRINSLLSIAKSPNIKEHEGVRKRMSNALLLIAALYSQDLINDNVFQSCAVNKLTSLLNCKEVADLLVILAKKINEDCDENIQLQAKVLGLESLQEMKFSEIFVNIKDDLMEIKGN